MSFFTHQFEGVIDRFGVGKARKIWYNVLFLPKELEDGLPFDVYPRLRVDGEIAEIPISNAFIPTGDGRYYVIVAPNVLKDGDVAIGDIVEMRFKIADQDHVDVPEQLLATIRRSETSVEAWDGITPGKKRMLAQHVSSAKTEPTRQKRIAEAIDALIDFNADLRAWRKEKRQS